MKSPFWMNNFTKCAYLQIFCIKQKNKKFRFIGLCKISLSMLEKGFLKWVFQKKQLVYHFFNRISSSSSALNLLPPTFVLLYRHKKAGTKPGQPCPSSTGIWLCMWCSRRARTFIDPHKSYKIAVSPCKNNVTSTIIFKVKKSYRKAQEKAQKESNSQRTCHLHTYIS